MPRAKIGQHRDFAWNVLHGVLVGVHATEAAEYVRDRRTTMRLVQGRALGVSFLVLTLMSACSPTTNGRKEGNTSGGGAPWTTAQVDAAFSKEWDAWKLSKYEAMSQQDRDKLALRGAGNPRNVVDQSLERQAQWWKADLQSEFSARISGYRQLLDRLNQEGHPSPQREQTAWFDALVSEVRKKAGG